MTKGQQLLRRSSNNTQASKNTRSLNRLRENRNKENKSFLPTRTVSKRKPSGSVNIVSLLLGLTTVCFTILGFASYKLHVQGLSDATDATDASPRSSGSSASSSSSSGVQYHMVFSTSCSAFQDWQSYVFFHSAFKVKQPGTVTRIASGCTPEQSAKLKKVHEEQIAILSKDFHLHLTPDFSGPEHGRDFQKIKYFNKPFGLLHYMENALGYPAKAAENDNSIIMIVDPDMMLLRPLKHTFHDYPDKYWRKSPRPIISEVKHGFPIAQAYAYGERWLTSLKDNVTHVTGPDSPVLTMSLDDAGKYYPAGPPYLATARDMYQIATHWVDFVPRVREVFPEMMAEMHAYSTAAAHLKLPHQLSEKFMISEVGNGQEGWDFLKDVSRQDACVPNVAEEDLPFVLHYCQRYALGRWFIGKYKVPENLFTCEAPLLRVPPRDVAVKYDWYIYPNNVEMEDYGAKKDDYSINQNAYAMCTMIDELNEVASHFKKHHCDEATANYEKSHVFTLEEGAFEKFLNSPKPVDLLAKAKQ